MDCFVPRDGVIVAFDGYFDYAASKSEQEKKTPSDGVFLWLKQTPIREQ